MANKSLTVSCSGISFCQLSISNLCKCFTEPLLNFSSRNRLPRMHSHPSLSLPTCSRMWTIPPKSSFIPLSRSRGLDLLILEAMVGTSIAEWATHLHEKRLFYCHSLPLLQLSQLYMKKSPRNPFWYRSPREFKIKRAKMALPLHLLLSLVPLPCNPVHLPFNPLLLFLLILQQRLLPRPPLLLRVFLSVLL